MKYSGHRHNLFDGLLIAGTTALLGANLHSDIPHVRPIMFQERPSNPLPPSVISNQMNIIFALYISKRFGGVYSVKKTMLKNKFR